MLFMRIFILGVLVIFFSPINSISSELAFPKFDANGADSICKKKWSKRGVLNENMHKYCMDLKAEDYEEALAIYNEYKSEKWIDDVVKFSFEKWTKEGNTDYTMVGFQLKTEKEGFLNVQYGIQQNSLSQDIVNKCKKKWYPQYSMIDFCTTK